MKERWLNYERGEIAHIENVMATESRTWARRKFDSTSVTTTLETERTEDTEESVRNSMEAEVEETLSTASNIATGLTAPPPVPLVTLMILPSLVKNLMLRRSEWPTGFSPKGLLAPTPAFAAAARKVLSDLGTQKLVSDLDEATRLFLLEGKSDAAKALVAKISVEIEAVLTEFAQITPRAMPRLTKCQQPALYLVKPNT